MTRSSRPSLHPFHLAVPVRDLEEARHFYGQTLGLEEGRSSEHWIDFNLFGHQFVVHLDPALGPEGKVARSESHVDSHGVPVPHFGVVLNFEEWETFAQHLEGRVDYVLAPTVRFRGQAGEQGTLFFFDPSGNALEFKGFRDIEGQLFTRD